VSAQAPSPPSAFFVRWLPALADASARGPVLDLACGRGRHALAAARAGLRCVALDRNAGFLAELAAEARRQALPVEALRCDLETGLAPPLREACFGAVLVFRYLHRPLAPWIEGLLAPGGLLLYETFTNPAFLLEPGELPRLFPKLETLAFEEGVYDGAACARLAARRP